VIMGEHEIAKAMLGQLVTAKETPASAETTA
jgi:hypothetical protein